jgi:hypothetical protein
MKSPLSLFRVLITATLLAVTAVTSSAVTFLPNDNDGDPDDILDLDHYKYFTWGFKNFFIPEGEHITSATISFSNINNWTSSENGYWQGNVHVAENWLNIWLLDKASSASTNGKLKVYDDSDGGPDYFSTWNSSAKVKIATYTDWDGGNNGDVVNLNYSFADRGVLDELEAYVNNGNNFAIGIDPDCHYWNSGVTLVIQTSPYSVPDQSSVLPLLGISMGLLFSLRRRAQR